MSKERPIIFSAPMVRAILEGRKSMTRRIVKCREEIACLGTAADWNAGKLDERMPDWETWGPKSGAQVFVGKHGNIFSLNCPYGVPGDRLWVREKFDFFPCGMTECEIFYWADGSSQKRTPPNDYNPYLYPNERVRPSIHMPRWASRITLEIASVRVERVKEITPQDCEAEGITGTTSASPVRGLPYEQYKNGDGLTYTEPLKAFQALWESIHGPGSWDLNPYVWAISFKVVP